MKIKEKKKRYGPTWKSMDNRAASDKGKKVGKKKETGEELEVVTGGKKKGRGRNTSGRCDKRESGGF